MSKLRPECGTAGPGSIFVPRDTALFLIRDAVDRRHGLIHGHLHGPNKTHCAIGCFWADNPRAVLDSSLIDEVAAVNDSLGLNATPRQRWLKVRSWLRFKLRVLAGTGGKTS
jgi:hypothetical protein